jgi:hypothetical protein
VHQTSETFVIQIFLNILLPRHVNKNIAWTQKHKLKSAKEENSGSMAEEEHLSAGMGQNREGENDIQWP